MSKAETAYQILRKDILDTILFPEAPLTISLLTERYGYGWTPMREALARLEGERLVHFSANRGYRVAAVSDKELADLARARRVADTELFIASIINGDAAWESGIVAAHHTLSRTTPPGATTSEAGDRDWESAHQAFHDALLAAGQSPWLTRFSRQISDQLHRYNRYLVHDSILDLPPDSREKRSFEQTLAEAQSLRHHTTLMEIALERDADQGARVIDEHISLTLATYRAHPIMRKLIA